MSTSAQCSVSNNVLTINNPFGSTGSYSAGDPALSFIFNTGGTNPQVSTDAGQFEVTVGVFVGGIAYPINSSPFTGKYTPDPAKLTAVVTPSSLTTYDSPVIYSFAITPSASIAKGSAITIEFPTEISMAGINFPSCSFTINGQTSSSASFQTITTVPPTVEISDVF
jgi:hypothetical protein